MNVWFPIVASVLLAFIPVLVWLRIIHREGEEKSLYIKTFLFGTLAVIPPFILILLFEKFPQLNIYSLIDKTVEEVALAALLTNILVGVIEELAKNIIVRIIDKRHPEYIQTVTAALKLSICAGLGFAFAENIFYFYNIWVDPLYAASDLFATFVFRSAFTMVGHMVFSGIFGYYFGIGKFAADIAEHERLAGDSLRFTRFLSRLTGKLTFQVFREQKNITGLFLAMGIHATFNVSLDLEHKLPAILIIAISALYILYLMQRKTGYLLFSIGKRRGSSMAPRDQDVVMELLGMWTREGRLDEVVKICDRLLERDPDNNVVKLFKAKAADNKELRQAYEAMKVLFKKETSESPQAVSGVELKIEDEKVVLEVMDGFYKDGNYKKVLDVAKNLLAKNPQSQGARVLLEKAMDKEKLKKVFEAIEKLFRE